MTETPDVTVAAVAESAGRFLLVEERISHRLLFNQPAGHVEHGETLLQAVVREALEETAWRFEPRAMLGVYRWRNPSSRRLVLRFAFSGTVSGHDPKLTLDHPIVRTHWLDPDAIEAYRDRLRSPLVLRCVRDYLAGRGRPLDDYARLDLAGAAAVEPTDTVA